MNESLSEEEKKWKKNYLDNHVIVLRIFEWNLSLTHSKEDEIFLHVVLSNLSSTSSSSYNLEDDDDDLVKVNIDTVDNSIMIFILILMMMLMIIIIFMIIIIIITFHKRLGDNI